MLIHVLLVAHIAVLGYWLGSELVINNGYRYFSRAAGLPVPERLRLMDHVMDIDQHVRYALVLQFALGGILAARMGYFPGGNAAAVALTLFGVAWLLLVELTHRLRKTPAGATLATVDRYLRYAIMLGLLAVAVATALGTFHLAGWLAAKLACFAGVMACGLGIRFALMPLGSLLAELGECGSTAALELRIWRVYVRSTTILGLLWVFIALVVWLSTWKP